MKHKLNLSIILRSLVFWVLACAALPVYVILAVLVIPLAPKVRHRIIMTAPIYFTFLLKYVGGIKYTVRGLENVPSSPAIFAGNHQSAWETVVLNCFLPPCVWIMKKEVFNIPFYGWAVRALSTIAIDRKKGENSMTQVISQGKQRFGLGFWIIMFPEGTRIKPKLRKPFKHGVAKLALSLDVPVVPFAHNAGYFLPRNSIWLYPGCVSVVVGAPIYPDDKEIASFTKKIENWIHHELDEMGS